MTAPDQPGVASGEGRRGKRPLRLTRILGLGRAAGGRPSEAAAGENADRSEGANDQRTGGVRSASPPVGFKDLFDRVRLDATESDEQLERYKDLGKSCLLAVTVIVVLVLAIVVGSVYLAGRLIHASVYVTIPISAGGVISASGAAAASVWMTRIWRRIRKRRNEGGKEKSDAIDRGAGSAD